MAKKTLNDRLNYAKKQIQSIKKFAPMNDKGVLGKSAKPKPSKIKMGPRKVSSTLPMKKGKPVARTYTKKIVKR